MCFRRVLGITSKVCNQGSMSCTCACAVRFLFDAFFKTCIYSVFHSIFAPLLFFVATNVMLLHIFNIFSLKYFIPKSRYFLQFFSEIIPESKKTRSFPNLWTLKILIESPKIEFVSGDLKVLSRNWNDICECVMMCAHVGLCLRAFYNFSC